MYKKIRYNTASDTLRLDFPWRNTPTAVHITIVDRNGSDLLAETSTTVTAADSLVGAVSSGDSTCTLSTGAAWVRGDTIQLSGGRDEIVTVESYASATKTITFANPCEWDHASSTAVKSRFATYALDTTSTSVWTKGLQCSLVWSPQSVDESDYSEAAQVVSFAFDVEGLLHYFRVVYPLEYSQGSEVLDALEEMATTRLAQDVALYGRDLTRLRDPLNMREPLVHLIAWFACLRGGDEKADNAERAHAAYKMALESMSSSSPLWFDDDQDEAEDDNELDALKWKPYGPGRVGNW